ncbi:hypothetical protein ACFYO0_42255 [Streptomyces sp. NPDC006365]|uniref:hypothetical protein n=1 Tax=Streptomyces sp. NPDC006365 TaxID=3364744 RepID=UPI00369C0BD2
MADRRKDPNASLRAVRENELQMSRQEFAKLIVKTSEEMGEAVACAPRLVAAWEDGDVSLPRPVYRRILTRLTGRTMDELGFHLSSPARQVASAAVANGPEQEQAVDRRAFVTDDAGASLSLILIEPAADKPPRRIGVSDVRAVDQAVSKIYTHDHDYGSVVLRRSASQALHTAYQWLNTRVFTERTGRRLRSATGHLTIAAGWLSYDSGRPADARSLYNEALAAARIAHDPGPLRGTPSAASRSWPRHQAVPVR